MAEVAKVTQTKVDLLDLERALGRDDVPAQQIKQAFELHVNNGYTITSSWSESLIEKIVLGIFNETEVMEIKSAALTALEKVATVDRSFAEYGKIARAAEKHLIYLRSTLSTAFFPADYLPSQTPGALAEVLRRTHGLTGERLQRVFTKHAQHGHPLDFVTMKKMTNRMYDAPPSPDCLRDIQTAATDAILGRDLNDESRICYGHILCCSTALLERAAEDMKSGQ